MPDSPHTADIVERLERGPVWGNDEPIGSVVGAINGATMREAAAEIKALRDAMERIAELQPFKTGNELADYRRETARATLKDHRKVQS